MSQALSIALSMAVTRSEGSKRVPVGEVEVLVPSLQDFGFDVEVKSTDEEGIPVYATNELNWLQNAIKNATLANARNKLVPKTTELRAGATIPTTLEELTEPSLGGGNPEVLKQISAVKSMFKDYVAGLGKSAKVTALLIEAFGSTKSLGMQPNNVRERIAAYVEDFVAWAEAEGREFGSAGVAYIEKVLVACADEEEFDVDDL